MFISLGTLICNCSKLLNQPSSVDWAAFYRSQLYTNFLSYVGVLPFMLSIFFPVQLSSLLSWANYNFKTSKLNMSASLFVKKKVLQRLSNPIQPTRWPVHIPVVILSLAAKMSLLKLLPREIAHAIFLVLLLLFWLGFLLLIPFQACREDIQTRTCREPLS